MREVDNRRRWLLIVVLVMGLLFVPMVAVGVLYHSPPASSIYSSGHGETYPPETTTVDKALRAYIQIKTGGRSGGSGPGYSWNTITGNVTWIGSPRDAIKSLHNIQLSVYTRLDENDSWGKNTYMLVLGTHIEANLTEATFPVDVIDHQEVIIPTLGVNMPNYQYSFNCSYFTK